MNTTEHHELPSGWKWLKLGRIGEITLGQSPPSSSYRDTPEGLPFFQGKADFGATSPNPTSWCVSPRKIAEEGDILISVRAPVGPTNLADRQCCIGRGLASIRTGDGADTNFVLYALKNFETDLIKQGTGSTFDAITGSQLKNLYIAVPSLSEQVAIARYLDYVDVRVRRLTEAKRKLIGLLTEYKQAIIHRAVTRGLDPNVPLKDSGIEWLGMVPQHWELKRLGNLLRERGEVNTKGDIQEVLSVMKDRGVIPYGEKGNIGNKRSEDITRYKIVRPDDIVVNCMNVIIGSVGLSKYTGCLSPVYYVLTVRSERDDPRFLNAYFQTKPFQKSLVRIGNGILAHRMRIPMELLKCELFPRPPLPEQVAIAEYLDRTTAEIDIAVARAERQIELLNEYRTRLIADVVTGKLDVRDATLDPEERKN